MSVCAIVVAGGSGKRFGAAKPKQFQILHGKPLLFWPLRTLQKLSAVKNIVLVVPRDYVTWAYSFARREKFGKVHAVVEGGAERADSVRRGFQAVPPGTDMVLIHDAARAMVTEDIVRRVIAATRQTGAALAAWPVPDTMKRSENGKRETGSGKTKRHFVKSTIPRQGLWLAQTPQGLRIDVAEKIFTKKNLGTPTDDVQWVEKMGRPVELVLGSAWNFKITVAEDFTLCESLIRRSNKR